MKKIKILKIISAVLASLAFTICLLLWGEVSGLDQGYRSAINIEFIKNKDVSLPPQAGPSFYEVIVGGYAIIAACFYIYMVGTFLKQRALSHTLCLLSVSVIIYQFWQMFQYKHEVLEGSSRLPYTNWLLNSIHFDWFCVSIVALLLIIQVSVIIMSYVNKSNKILE